MHRYFIIPVFIFFIFIILLVLYFQFIDDEWKYKNFGKELFKGDFINLGVGQGYMLTTPLHLSLISGILAKKGKYQLPYLVAKKQNQLSINEEITEQDWNKLQASLIDVIYSPNGTGYRIMLVH